MHITILTISSSQGCLGAYIQIPHLFEALSGWSKDCANVLNKKQFCIMFSENIDKASLYLCIVQLRTTV